MKFLIIITAIAVSLVASCNDKTFLSKKTEATIISLEKELDTTVVSLPQDLLDSIVYNVVTRLQHFSDTNEYFKGIDVVSYSELKNMRDVCGVYNIFTRYDCKNVWGEIEHYSDVYTVTIETEDHNVVDTTWSHGDAGSYMNISNNFIKRGEIVVKVGGAILFHTKSLKKAQSELGQELEDVVYGPHHQPPVSMKLTGYASRSRGAMF